MSSGWIVRPVLFGPRVTVLPEHEGGHVVIKSEQDARLIASAPDLLEALIDLEDAIDVAAGLLAAPEEHQQALATEIQRRKDKARAAIARATGEAS
jgi:hypothetical protein